MIEIQTFSFYYVVIHSFFKLKRRSEYCFHGKGENACNNCSAKDGSKDSMSAVQDSIRTNRKRSRFEVRRLFFIIFSRSFTEL